MKTKGATSYITLTLEELTSLVKPNGQIEVRRTFLENLRKANAVKVEKAESEGEKSKVQIQVENWD